VRIARYPFLHLLHVTKSIHLIDCNVIARNVSYGRALYEIVYLSFPYLEGFSELGMLELPLVVDGYRAALHTSICEA
jgi:hypothetical protein